MLVNTKIRVELAHAWQNYVIIMLLNDFRHRQKSKPQ